MEDSPIKKTSSEEKGSSFPSDSVINTDSAIGVEDGSFNELADFALTYDKFSEFGAPLKMIGRAMAGKNLLRDGEEKELFLCLVHLASFLRLLEIQLFDLCVKTPVSSVKLTILAEEASKLQCVAGEALAHFYKMTRPVKKSFEGGNNAPSEPAHEVNDHCGDDSSSDAMPIKSKHGDDLTPFV